MFFKNYVISGMLLTLSFFGVGAGLLTSCSGSSDPDDNNGGGCPDPDPITVQERILLLNEGNWQADNGRMTYFADGKVVSNQWFRDQNKMKLGDTPNDMIMVTPDIIAIAINWSNIIQFINTDGKAIAATEDVPNNRCLATDGSYLYVTSYGHECGSPSQGFYATFDKGYVAKIDIKTFKIVAATEVGYEPEGIAYYNGKLFVANSGGYAFQEDHEYETTVSVINAATMQVVKTIDTGCKNLYGSMPQSGKYLLISSCGDYYETLPCSIVLDCEKALTDEPCFKVLDAVSTFSTTAYDGKFYAIGSAYSYIEGGYSMTYSTIDPVAAFNGGNAVSNSLPGTLVQDIENFATPYGIYVNPHTGYIYATDAAGNVEGGKLYQWDPSGKLLGSYDVYINPGHFLALPPK